MNNNLAEKKNRDIGIDIARGIAMLAVVWGHIQGGYFTRWVYSFHIPLFFILSGYLISEKDSLKTYSIKRLKQLMLPYLVTCVILILHKLVTYSPSVPNLIIACLYGCGSGRAKLPAGINVIGAIWFLPANALALILVKFISNKRFAPLWILLIAAASHISAQYLWLPMNIQAAGLSALFVYIGWVARKASRQYAKSHKLQLIMTDTGRTIIILVGLCAWVCGLIVPGLCINLAANYPLHVLPCIIVALLVSAAVILLAYDLQGSKLIGKGLAFCGRNSLAILCLHLIESRVLPWSVIEQAITAPNDTYKIIIIFSLKVLVLVALVYIASAIPIFRKVFGIKCKFPWRIRLQKV